jgi:hypothetical protein
MSTAIAPTAFQLSHRPSRPTTTLPNTSEIPISEIRELLELANQRLALRKPYATLALSLVLRRLSQLSQNVNSGTQLYEQYCALDLSPLEVAMDTELRSVVTEVLEVEEMAGTEEVEDLWEFVKTEWKKVAADLVVAAVEEPVDGEGEQLGGRLLAVLAGALEGVRADQLHGEAAVSQWEPDCGRRDKGCAFKPVGRIQELLYAFVEDFINGPH